MDTTWPCRGGRRDALADPSCISQGGTGLITITQPPRATIPIRITSWARRFLNPEGFDAMLHPSRISFWPSEDEKAPDLLRKLLRFGAICQVVSSQLHRCDGNQFMHGAPSPERLSLYGLVY